MIGFAGRPSLHAHQAVYHVLRAGIEPAASALSGRRSDRLSYRRWSRGRQGYPPWGFLTPTWTLSDSNRPPPACKAGALPDELKALVRRDRYPREVPSRRTAYRLNGPASVCRRDSNPKPSPSRGTLYQLSYSTAIQMRRRPLLGSCVEQRIT